MVWKERNKKVLKILNVPPILRLPVEIRDEIYRELLIAAKVRDEETEKLYLKPAIVRVNKQIHKESSRVLYEENAWILIRMNWCDFVGSLVGFENPIVSHSPYGHLDGFFRKPALQIDVKRLPSRNPYAGASILFDAYSMSQVLRCLIDLDLQGWVRFSVQFNPGMSKLPIIRDDMLFSLRYIRGFREAIVSGIDESTAKELATLMMTPVKSVDEYLERADAYQKLGDQRLARGHPTDADWMYVEGANYIKWAKESQIWRLPDYNWQTSKELSHKFSTMFIKSALCDIENGDLDVALDKLNTILGHGQYLSESQIAKARYHSGLALLKQGKDGWALRYFTRALDAQPEDEGAAEEIRKIQSRRETTDLHRKYPNYRRCFLAPGHTCYLMQMRENAAQLTAEFASLSISSIATQAH